MSNLLSDFLCKTCELSNGVFNSRTLRSQYRRLARKSGRFVCDLPSLLAAFVASSVRDQQHEEVAHGSGRYIVGAASAASRPSTISCGLRVRVAFLLAGMRPRATEYRSRRAKGRETGGRFTEKQEKKRMTALTPAERIQGGVTDD